MHVKLNFSEMLAPYFLTLPTEAGIFLECVRSFFSSWQVLSPLPGRGREGEIPAILWFGRNCTDLFFNTAALCDMYTRKIFYIKKKKFFGCLDNRVSLEVTVRNHVAITLQVCSSVIFSNLHAGGTCHVWRVVCDSNESLALSTQVTRHASHGRCQALA